VGFLKKFSSPWTCQQQPWTQNRFGQSNQKWKTITSPYVHERGSVWGCSNHNTTKFIFFLDLLAGNYLFKQFPPYISWSESYLSRPAAWGSRVCRDCSGSENARWASPPIHWCLLPPASLSAEQRLLTPWLVAGCLPCSLLT